MHPATAGDMRNPNSNDSNDSSELPGISEEQLAEVQGGAGFADSFMQFLPLMMIMRQRQQPPAVAVAAPPPPPGDWQRVA